MPTRKPFKYNIGAKPTVYKGQRFRSRGEARWAAFFDLCGWRWEYEARDLPDWVPDFLLVGCQRVWVEVKPITALAELDLTEYEAALRAAGIADDFLVLGVGPFLSTTWGRARALGWLGECVPNGWSWDEAIVGFTCPEPPLEAVVDFAHASQSYAGRMSGLHGGNPPDSNGPRGGVLDAMWGRACSTVQWLPPA